MFARRYSDKDTYQVIHYYNGGFRILPPDQHDYLEWVEAGNIPPIEAEGRFLSVIDGAVVVDPKKDNILAQEEYKRQETAIINTINDLDIQSIPWLREHVVKKGDASEALQIIEAKVIAEKIKLAGIPKASTGI